MQSRALLQVLSPLAGAIIVFGLKQVPPTFKLVFGPGESRELTGFRPAAIWRGAALPDQAGTGILRLPRRISLTFFRFSSHTEVCRTTAALLQRNRSKVAPASPR